LESRLWRSLIKEIAFAESKVIQIEKERMNKRERREGGREKTEREREKRD